LRAPCLTTASGNFSLSPSSLAGFLSSILDQGNMSSSFFYFHENAKALCRCIDG
jgi:hypothetical protein